MNVMKYKYDYLQIILYELKHYKYNKQYKFNKVTEHFSINKLEEKILLQLIYIIIIHLITVNN